MLRRPTFRAWFLLAFVILSADARAQNVARGQLQFDTLASDVGRIHRGEKRHVSFRFKNVGNGPISVKGVHAACGCTAVEGQLNRVYQPGEIGAVEVTFDSTDFVGKVVKAVTLMTDQTAIPTRTLTIIADIVADLAVDPPVLDFGDVRGDEELSKEFSVKQLLDSKVELKGVRGVDGLVRIEDISSQKERRFRVTLLPQVMRKFVKEKISVLTTSEHLPEISVLVRANILGAISATPAYVEFGAISPQQASERWIKIEGIRPFSVQDYSVELNVNGASIRDGQAQIEIVKDASAKSQQEVLLRLRNKGVAAGSVHGRILVQTTEPSQKQLSVDFYAFFL